MDPKGYTGRRSMRDIPVEYLDFEERMRPAMRRQRIVTAFLATIALVAVCVCIVAIAKGADLPNPELTPGVVEPRLTKDRLCAPGFTTRSWRHVSSGLSHKVYKSYGMAAHEGLCAVGRGCEVDHLIALELGGSNNIHNLWPQPYQGQVWNAAVKDELENELHRQVCADELSLEEAQVAIRTDWIAAWKKAFKRSSP